MYYNNLSPISKAIYNQIKIGLQKHLSSFTVLCNKPTLVSELFKAVRLDNPEIFFVKEITIQYSSVRCTIIPEYLYSEKESSQINATINQKMSAFLNKWLMIQDEIQKVKAIHDYLCATVSYHNSASMEDHCMIGPLLHGNGVCEGIANAFLYLAMRLGMDAMLVFGEAKQMNTTVYSDHAWNIVCVSGKNYHIDVTFDLTLTADNHAPPRYDYFLLTDNQIGYDHKAASSTVIKLPPCMEEYNFYAKSGMYAESLSKLKTMISYAVQHRRGITFQLPMLSGEISDVPHRIQCEVDRILEHHHVSASYNLSYNLTRMIFCFEIHKYKNSGTM